MEEYNKPVEKTLEEDINAIPSNEGTPMTPAAYEPALTRSHGATTIEN